MNAVDVQFSNAGENQIVFNAMCVDGILRNPALPQDTIIATIMCVN